MRAASAAGAVGAALAAAGTVPPRDARALLAQVLGVSRETLVAHPERPVDEAAWTRYAALVGRRAAGEPLAYLLGQQEFHGRPFAVGPAVLVPRPETELLVDVALEYLGQRRGARVLDLGTGCGCIAITLALELTAARITALDRSGAALSLARANGSRLGAQVTWLESDWYAALAGRPPGAPGFDAIVANPPYIAANDPHLAALHAEPAAALTDGGDGLGCLRTIIGLATEYLAPGGLLAVEHGYDQGAAVRALFHAAGLVRIETRRDAAGHPRVCLGFAG